MDEFGHDLLPGHDLMDFRIGDCADFGECRIKRLGVVDSDDQRRCQTVGRK